MAVEVDGRLQGFPQAGLGFRLGLHLPSAPAEVDANPLRQEAQSLGEIPAFLLHQEAENVPALVAGAEAAPGPGVGEHDEGRRAGIGVERAKPGVVPPGFAELDRLADQLDDVGPFLDFVNGGHR